MPKGIRLKDLEVSQEIVGATPREAIYQQIVGANFQICTGKSTGETCQDYRESVLNHGPLTFWEIRRIAEVLGEDALGELHRLADIAGQQGIRYLLSPIILYDDLKMAFQTIASSVKTPSDLQQCSVGIPRNYIKEFFEQQVRLYNHRRKHGISLDPKFLQEDLLDAFSRSHMSGGGIPIRQKPKKTENERWGRRNPSEEELSPSQENAMRRLEDGLS